MFKLFVVPKFDEILKSLIRGRYSFTHKKPWADFLCLGQPGADSGDCIDALQLHPLLVTQIALREGCGMVVQCRKSETL